MKRFLVMAALMGLTQAGAAQNASRLSVDLDATLWGSRGGVYREHSGGGLDLLGSLRVREISNGAWIAGLGAGFQEQIGGGDAICVRLKTGGCAPDLPSFTSWSALAGWEGGRPRDATLRLLVGPTLYSGGGSAHLAATARADVATPTLVHFALTATGRGSLVSTLPGGATSLWAFGVGVRVR